MDDITRDFYEERRRKWRRNAFWRGFGAAFLFLIVLGLILGRADLAPSAPHIAEVKIEGVIYDDPEFTSMLEDLREDETARAVILNINSPGGTTVGAEALYVAIRDLAETKPVVARMREVAASGGYVAAIAADHVIARGNTLTGSIGVIMEYPDVTELMDRIGVEMETIRSSEFKAAASPFRDLSPEARAREEQIIADTYQWFRDLVSERRGLNGADLSDVADGSVFTGRLALENGLIDEIGGQKQALTWLEAQDAALADLPVETWQLPEEPPGVLDYLGMSDPAARLLQRLDALSGPRLRSILN